MAGYISMTSRFTQSVHNILDKLNHLIDGADHMSSLSAVRIIPESSIANRSLVIVIAIMTFLAVSTAGVAMLVRDSAAQWGNQISKEITIQIKPLTNRNIERDIADIEKILKDFPGISSFRAFSRDESTKMLSPWLASSIGLDELPVPRLIAVKPGASSVNTELLNQRLRDANLPVIVDDHRLWRERLTTMTNGLLIVALFVLCLVLAAMVLAIAFATQGAMSGTRDIIDVMHFIGAHDRFISQEFQKHFFRLGLKGSTIGTVAAIAFIMGSEYLARSWTAGAGSEQIQALFGSFTVSWTSLAIILGISSAIAFLVGWISAFIVSRHLSALR